MALEEEFWRIGAVKQQRPSAHDVKGTRGRREGRREGEVIGTWRPTQTGQKMGSGDGPGDGE